MGQAGSEAVGRWRHGGRGGGVSTEDSRVTRDHERTSFWNLISGVALLCPCSALTGAIPLTMSSPAMVRCPPNPVQEGLLQDLTFLPERVNTTFCFMSVTPSDRLSLL